MTKPASAFLFSLAFASIAACDNSHMRGDTDSGPRARIDATVVGAVDAAVGAVDAALPDAGCPGGVCACPPAGCTGCGCYTDPGLTCEERDGNIFVRTLGFCG